MPSNTILPVVERRSTQPSNRCIPTELETSGATACFSPFFNDRKSSIIGQNRGGGCNSNNTKLASTTLVQSGSRIICSQTSASTSVKQHLSKSSGPGTPSCREQNPKTSGQKSFRQSLASEGISERAAELIPGARRPSTSFNYKLAWCKWVSWCGEREINPHSCHLNFVLDFLAQLFEKKFEYSTINTYRSALSVYHDKVDNRPMSKHSNVCNLMTGVFNRKQPKPRYIFIWDIEQMLAFIRKIPNNTELPDRNISFKFCNFAFSHISRTMS